MLKIRTLIGIGTLLLILFGSGFYYWRLEGLLNKTSETEVFEEEPSQVPLLYRHEAYGVSMTYPADWQLSTPPETEKSTIIAQFTPKTGDSLIIIPQVKIEVMPAKTNSLEKYTTNHVYQLTQQSQMKILDSRPVKFAGGDGHEVLYTVVDPNNGLEEQYLQTWTLKADLAYILTYQAAIGDFPDFAETVEQDMFNSMQIDVHSKPKAPVIK